MYQESSSLPSPPDAAGAFTDCVPDTGSLQDALEVASSVSTLSPTLEAQIVTIEQRMLSLKAGSSADDLVDDLLKWGKEAGESAATALSAAQYAILYAWATGCVLNLAKESVVHGSFGKWRDVKAGELGISVRKAQQWMKLAKDCWDVRALLVPGATITGAYRATGVLPEPPSRSPGEDDHEAEDGEPPAALSASSSTEPAFKALTVGRERLRHLLQSGEILGEKDRDRLEEEKSAYLALFEKLLNPSSHE